MPEGVVEEEIKRHLESEGKLEDDNHTFLFIVDRGIVIDAGVNGNDARFINHGCDPNCESVTEDRRVFVEAIRTIQPGEELKYDYSIGRAKDDPPDVDEVFACHCGAPKCRGTMLWPAKRPKPRKLNDPPSAPHFRISACHHRSTVLQCGWQRY